MTTQERMQMQLDKQDGQINDLFKSVREIKNMNLSNKAMFKGLLIGFGLMSTYHADDEHCLLSDMKDAASILAKLIKKFH